MSRDSNVPDDLIGNKLLQHVIKLSSKFCLINQKWVFVIYWEFSALIIMIINSTDANIRLALLQQPCQNYHDYSYI